MLIGLYLYRRNRHPNEPCDLVAYAKTLEEIVGWYKWHKLDHDGPLKEFILLEDTIYNLRTEDGPFGFFEIADLDMITQDCEDMVNAVNNQARMHLDNYRSNVEPKAISFDIHSTPKRSLQ